MIILADMRDLIQAMLSSFVLGAITGAVVGAIITVSIFRRRERAAIQSLSNSTDELDAAVKSAKR